MDREKEAENLAKLLEKQLLSSHDNGGGEGSGGEGDGLVKKSKTEKKSSKVRRIVFGVGRLID